MKKPIECNFIGHSTTLLTLGKSKILTDPHFGNRVVLAKRQKPLELDGSLLEDLSSIIISHMHYDHLNVASYKYISSAVPVIVPENTEPMIGRLINNPVIELSHWATHELVDGTKITAVPIHHRGGRLSQLRYTGSNGYIIQKDDVTVYFCGDSSYGSHFKEIGNLYHIDLALLPIGAYSPRWFMRSRHMTPAEAVNAFEDTRANYMIPIHWGTFKISFENPQAPAEWMKKIFEDRPDLAQRIFLIEPGQTAVLPIEENPHKIEVQNKAHGRRSRAVQVSSS